MTAQDVLNFWGAPEPGKVWGRAPKVRGCGARTPPA